MVDDRLQEIKAPADGSCLFWSVALSYLIPIKNNKKHIEERCKALFGDIKDSDEIQKFLQNYNTDEVQTLKDSILNNLVTVTFRSRVADYILEKRSKFKPYINEDFDQYISKMREASAWGGEPEIKAMSEMLSVKIMINGNLSLYGKSNEMQINLLFYENENHYNFGLEQLIIDKRKQKANEQKTNERKELKSGDNHQLKSGQKQKPQPDYQIGDTGEQPSRYSNSSEDEFYDASNHLDSINEKAEESCGNDSDLESIPTVSHFKQRTWNGSKKASGPGKIFSKDGTEYLKKKSEDGKLVCSGKFSYRNINFEVRNTNAGSLLTSDRGKFVARVQISDQRKLGKTFTDAKRDFFERLAITKVLDDKLSDERNAAYRKFKGLLQDRSDKTANNIDYAEDLLQLSIMLKKHEKLDDLEFFKRDINNNKYISSELENVIKDLLDKETALRERNKNFPKFDFPESDDFPRSSIKNLLKELQIFCNEMMQCHKKFLRNKFLSYNFQSADSTCFSINDLDNLSKQKALYISSKDIDLLFELANVMKEQLFSEFLDHLKRSLFKRVNEIKEFDPYSLKVFAPLTHPVYSYLCKSFQELVLEISNKTGISVNDLLKKNERNEWYLIKTINWPSPSFLTRSLEHQYRFIFKLMKHFEPGYYSSKRKFEHKFKLLQNPDGKEHSAIPEERLVWIYILDSAISDLPCKEELNSFKRLIESYADFIKNSKDNSYDESFRTATHNVIRFIAQTIPYLSKDILEIEQYILKKQVKSIEEAFEQFSDFRDLIDVYNEYWINRESIIEKIPEKFPHGKFKQDMEKIRKTLLNIVNDVLAKKGKSQGLIECFRSFNDFLKDLDSIEFSWFIKKVEGVDYSTEVKLVGCKDSYEVLDPGKFIEEHTSIPRHYLIEITQDLLNIVSNLLKQKRWSDDDNLSALSELLLAIRKSFLYLKEQHNYVSFDTFKESTKPFSSVLENSSSCEDFRKRIGIVGESFWYLRKQDEIDIKKALELYRKKNSHSTVKQEKILEDCYGRYLDEFHSYIQRTHEKDYQDKIKFITEEVQKQSKQIKIDELNPEFKKETLPKLLAGLAAVWSIRESKDIAITEKSLKPHCIQILCILRLLSVDEDSKGIKKHLAQVLTGQGKSLVLGLLSSLLALMGKKVRTVCYSKYLADRDNQDFEDFFREFNISDRITYDTFDEMANEILEPKVNGKKQYLRGLVENRILHHSAKKAEQIKREDISNTVLLIDEVDVFFSDQFYGNTYNPCTTIKMPALAIIQEKIWEIATKNWNADAISKEVEAFIRKEIEKEDKEFQEFYEFLFKPGKYNLLKKEGNVFTIKEYTNRELYNEHLKVMIDNAISVAKGADKDRDINRYKINDDGIISYRRDDGFYSTYCCLSYYNVFNYFRLKKRNYSDEEYRNYGYLKIDCGEVSYAKLPEEYHLILGVSGTLTTLNDHEKAVVKESYKINENSIMPSFFGSSHLEYDSSQDFTSQGSEEEWLSKIYAYADSKISSGRSVLIFFDTDIEIGKFEEKFRSKFDRLYILTENTKDLDKKRYVDEAGITKTITLATRGMGRGVDFKSSVTVEKNGGVHVIQTFFSLDIKEETQIKGRTARKDNKGSYELILCKEHLIKAGFLEEEKKEDPVDYQSLNQVREKKIKKKGDSNAEEIKRSGYNHEKTMDFFNSFFESQCSTKLEQTSGEPVVNRNEIGRS